MVRRAARGAKLARVQFRDAYDIPEEVRRGYHSPAFAQFLHHWFIDSMGLSRREVDLSFIKDLTPQETEVAKDLLRRNLRLRHTHVIEGVAEMADVAAVPFLQAMLVEEPDLSRQLTIAGTLWKLVGDPSFVDCLNRNESQQQFLSKTGTFPSDPMAP